MVSFLTHLQPWVSWTPFLAGSPSLYQKRSVGAAKISLLGHHFKHWFNSSVYTGGLPNTPRKEGHLQVQRNGNLEAHQTALCRDSYPFALWKGLPKTPRPSPFAYISSLLHLNSDLSRPWTSLTQVTPMISPARATFWSRARVSKEAAARAGFSSFLLPWEKHF